jgi:hypothetical protein
MLFATERSGSNLLRAILAAHSQITSPPPAGLLVALTPSADQFLVLAGQADRRVLIDHAVALTRLHWSPWEIELDPEDISHRVGSGSIWALFRELNEAYAEQKKCRAWLTKEPQAILWRAEIADHFPDARFILLVRDGRDVANSMLKSELHEFHVFSAASIWAREQRAAREMLESPQYRDRTICIHYEDLIADPRGQVSRLAEFIGVEYEKQMLSFHRDPENIEFSKKTDLWKNIAKPISKDSVGKYKSGLSRRQVRTFEAVAWEELSYFGYAPEFSRRPPLGSGRRWLLGIWAQWLGAAQKRLSPEYWRRSAWRKRVKLMQNFGK